MTMRKFYQALVLALVASVISASWSRAAEPIRIIELRGDGPAMGKAHGQALGEQIRSLHKFFDAWFRNDDKQRKQALLAAFIFRNQLPPEYQAEMAAVAESAGLDAGELMLGNCFLDLSPMVACSTVTLSAKAAPDGIARFGRNLDFPSFNIADKASVVLVFHPKDRYKFAAVTWPGLIGVLSGMNEHGLTLANMEVTRNMGFPKAMPYMLLYRTVLEQCKTVDEAIDLLEKTPRQTANNLMLMDASGQRAVVEITPEKIIVRKAPEDQPLISTNHHRGTDLQRKGQCRRYDTLLDESLNQFGKIEPATIQAMLGRVAQGDATLQSMVFEPSTRVIYLAVGKRATTNEYQRIDLKNYFK
jgi:isopenicillin-N N-acyltransferase-like protein